MNDTIQSHASASRSLDTVFALLSNPRRRHAVAALAEWSSPGQLEELAEAVAAREADGDADEPNTHAVAADLHHTHLPKLDAADVVDYDAEERVVDPLEAEALASAAAPGDE